MKYILRACYILIFTIATASKIAVADMLKVASDGIKDHGAHPDSRSTRRVMATTPVPPPVVTDCWTCAAKKTSKICNYGGR